MTKSNDAHFRDIFPEAPEMEVLKSLRLRPMHVPGS